MGIGSAIGGAAQAAGSVAAANIQAKSADKAVAAQQQMYQQTRSDLLPYNTAGQSALTSQQALANQYNTGADTAATNNMALYAGAGAQEALWSGDQLNNAGNALTGMQTSLTAQNGATGSAIGSTAASQADLNAANAQFAQQAATTGQAGQYIGNAANATQRQQAVADSAGSYVSGANSNLAAAEAGNNLLANGISEDTLKNTPGYQFALQQGLESTQNSAAARGLGSSGAAEKAAAAYATGLADQTYQNQASIINQSVQNDNSLANTKLGQAAATSTQASQLGNAAQNYLNAGATTLNQAQQYGDTGTNFVAGANSNNAVTANLLGAASQYGSNAQNYASMSGQYQGIASGMQNEASSLYNASGAYGNVNSAQQGNITNDYNRLSGISSLGESAAAQTGNSGTQLANNAGNYLTQAGNASASGLIGAGNAISSGANNYMTYQLYNSLINPQTTTVTDQNIGATGYRLSSAYNG